MTYFKSKRTFTFSVSSALITEGHVQFAANDLTEIGSMSSLYDEYKLCAIKITVFPRGNSYNISQGDLTSGVLHDCIDYDDASAVGAVDDILQYGTHRAHRLTDKFSRYFKPCFSTAVYNGAASTAYGARRGFIDMANTGVPHYGWKWIAQIGGVPGTTFYFDVVATYYIACRGRR